MMYALKTNMKCTKAAMTKMNNLSISYLDQRFSDDSYMFGDDTTIANPIWKYHTCLFNHITGGMHMHSYVWIRGELHGNGFTFSTLPDDKLQELFGQCTDAEKAYVLSAVIQVRDSGRG